MWKNMENLKNRFPTFSHNRLEKSPLRCDFTTVSTNSTISTNYLIKKEGNKLNDFDSTIKIERRCFIEKYFKKLDSIRPGMIYFR